MLFKKLPRASTLTCYINHMHYEGNLFRALWRFLRPETDEVTVYIIIAFIFVGYAAYRLAGSGTLGLESQDLLNAARDTISHTSSIFSTGSGWARFFLFGFWFIIGTLAYFLIWFVTNIVIDIRNDIAISVAFIHPRSFHQSNYWTAVAIRSTLRTLAGIAFVFYGAYWARFLAPFSLHLIEEALAGTSLLKTCLYVPSFLLVTWLSLHVATLLVRIALLRYRFS